jgi:hypothetical protein
MIRSSETPVLTRATRRNIPEDVIVNNTLMFHHIAFVCTRTEIPVTVVW